MSLKTYNFVAVDVETANQNRASICQIGIARYVAGELTEEWSSLIDPEDCFAWWNQSVHGITEDDVWGSPKFFEVADKLRAFMHGEICVAHTTFDQVAIARALAKYALPAIAAKWLDTALVTRRAWPEFSSGGYNLANICDVIGYEFMHHDALEDAKAAAHVLLTAASKTGRDIDGWMAP